MYTCCSKIKAFLKVSKTFLPAAFSSFNLTQERKLLSE